MYDIWISCSLPRDCAAALIMLLFLRSFLVTMRIQQQGFKRSSYIPFSILVVTIEESRENNIVKPLNNTASKECSFEHINELIVHYCPLCDTNFADHQIDVTLLCNFYSVQGC